MYLFRRFAGKFYPHIFRAMSYHGENALPDLQTDLAGSTMIGEHNELLGLSLSGRYRLEQWLGGDEDASFFVTSRPPEGHPAVLELIRENGPETDRRLALWERTRELSHPNILALFDAGRAEAAGASYVFAVFEFPEDNLAAAMENGALTDAEARDVWNAAVDALRYIHSQGLVHGDVDAKHIVAVGDTIKLTSDTLGEPADGYTAEDDFRELARTGLPPCPIPEASPEVAEAVRPLPRWIYAVIPAVLVVILLAIVLTRGSRPDSAAAPAPVAPRVAATPPANQVERSAPPAPRPEPATSRGAAKDKQGAMWRVIAYTYNSRRDAEKRIAQIARTVPGLEPAVFTPRGEGRSPYLVALGGRMSRAEAVRLQRRARAKGMPRDTFVRNYSE
jgi:hypothetical protein